MAPALVALAIERNGASTLTVSLNPRDLGEVQVHLVRAQDGTASLTVTADRAETLQQLALNAHHLHAALDAANVPATHRIVSFSLSGSPQPGSTTDDRGAAPDSRSGGGDPQQRQSRQNTTGSAYAGPPSATAGSLAAGADTVGRRWMTAGLNITA
ncbi:flagellar hook-length control protein FliK [Lichenicoccus roseus]|uniref:flagellar hook-length control protein FliK n=1 Tax=Lichenicoccus roseus TaxID=2683649 RepID=UPI001486CBE2|nr:flagellar hook-length control protein FliK [Lichenicoccus roseus]